MLGCQIQQTNKSPNHPWVDALDTEYIILLKPLCWHPHRTIGKEGWLKDKKVLPANVNQLTEGIRIFLLKVSLGLCMYFWASWVFDMGKIQSKCLDSPFPFKMNYGQLDTPLTLSICTWLMWPADKLMKYIWPKQLWYSSDQLNLSLIWYCILLLYAHNFIRPWKPFFLLFKAWLGFFAMQEPPEVL